MSLDRISAELEQRIGLDASALGPTVLSAAVQARMRALTLNDQAAYAIRVAEEPNEFQALAEAVVVSETWFFRGGGLFAYLAGVVREVAKRPVRLLSVPCGTGEEPYSLAIALHGAGVLPESWRLDAVDLSGRNLDHARRGRYGAFSFRQTKAELRDRYFVPVPGRWELHPALRAAVHFRQGNLIDPRFLAEEEAYDVVLCRNLFIYLTPAARRQALTALERLLAPEGLLCVGHAEPQHLADDGFERAGPVEYFAYRRRLPLAIARSSSPLSPVLGGEGRKSCRPRPTISRSPSNKPTPALSTTHWPPAAPTSSASVPRRTPTACWAWSTRRGRSRPKLPAVSRRPCICGRTTTRLFCT